MRFPVEQTTHHVLVMSQLHFENKSRRGKGETESRDLRMGVQVDGGSGEWGFRWKGVQVDGVQVDVG